MKPNGPIRVSQSNVGQIKNQSDQKGKDDPLGRTNRALLTSANGRIHRARAIDSATSNEPDSRASVQFMGTPGTGVIVMGCKSPVRDWESQGAQYTK